MKKNSNKMLLKMLNYTTFYYKEIFFKKGFKEVNYYLEIIQDEQHFIKFHNPDGPAIIIWTNNRIKRIEFWINGKRHRKWGPAVVYFQVSMGKLEVIKEEWYIDNIEMTEKDINLTKLKLNRINKLKKIM